MTKTDYNWGRVISTLMLAMCLRIVPLPSALAAFNPDWVLLVLLYWSMTLPERVGIFHAWTFGLLTDVLTGRLLGQYALAYTLIIYLCLKLHHRLRQFPLIQQSLFVFFCLLLSQLLIFFIKTSQTQAQLAATFWLPIVSGSVCWSLVYAVLSYQRPSKSFR